MGILLQAIRKILVELTDRIDRGECDTTEQQEERFLALCQLIADKQRRVSKYDACRYVGCSRAKFDRLVAQGRLPRGKKTTGWKELSWSLSDIDRYISDIRQKQI